MVLQGTASWWQQDSRVAGHGRTKPTKARQPPTCPQPWLGGGSWKRRVADVCLTHVTVSIMDNREEYQMKMPCSSGSTWIWKCYAIFTIHTLSFLPSASNHLNGPSSKSAGKLARYQGRAHTWIPMWYTLYRACGLPQTVQYIFLIFVMPELCYCAFDLHSWNP